MHFIKTFLLKKIAFLIIILTILSCKKEPIVTLNVDCEPTYSNGYNLDFYDEINDTIKSGDTFGSILDKYHISSPRILEIVSNVRDSFNVRSMRLNKPYTILTSKDTTQKAKVFIYHQNKVVSKVVDFSDSLPKAHTYKLPVKVVERKISGTIQDNFSNTLDSIGVRPSLAFRIADIYASTVDFYRLQKGDNFKVIFEERFINDTTLVGYGKIKAMVFNHRGKDLYAFRFVADTIRNFAGYYDEDGGVLERQFLKSPIKFQYRISSRFNLRRKIAYYGRVKAHRGTDFAAPYGTPIMATANGTVIASARRGGNGNYVKIRHDKQYMTQYLHMKRRKVKVGQYVKKGDIIGWVGMTGNTSGPHVCYRFWKNGVQVDPFKQLLPPAKPMKKELKPKYFKLIEPLKKELDN